MSDIPCRDCLYDDERLVKLCRDHEELLKALPSSPHGMTCQPAQQGRKETTQLVEEFIAEMKDRGWYVELKMKPLGGKRKKNGRTPT